MKNTRKIAWPLTAIALAASLYGCGGSDGGDNDSAPPPAAPPAAPSADDAVNKAVSNIDNVVVIFAENRSFDNLYSDFPGVDSPLATAKVAPQVDRDGSLLPTLPQVWAGVTVAAAQFDPTVPVVATTATTGMTNAPFAINELYPGVGLNAVNADLWHNFYQNQMQIDGGKNDMFAAWADSAGGLVMGHFTGNANTLPLWKVAQKYTMADHFFMGAFGGSFLNHQYLIAATPPVVPITATNSAKVATLSDGDQGSHLAVVTGTGSALVGPATTIFTTSSATITPDGFGVNTMQPPYQPSGNAPAADLTAVKEGPLADPANPTTVPPQTQANIGDYLTDKNVEWAWYSGGWGFQLARSLTPTGWLGGDAPFPLLPPLNSSALQPDGQPYVNFQFHHQPFNYFKRFDPTTTLGAADRADHLKDAGVQGEKFIADIRAGKLPPVAYYKPVGNLNEHNGYADVLRGDQHIADVISELEKSPQWGHMLVIVTYDENGGLWDHVAPPKGDRFGPGSRIPALIIGPTVRKNFVDHTMFDTTSILRFISRRWSLPELPGVARRRQALETNNGTAQGDLSDALDPAATGS